MSNALQEGEEVLAPSRGRFTFGAFGIAAIGAIASMLANAQPASAGLASPCCGLATNTRCGTSRCPSNCKQGCSSYDCPPNFQRHWWYCMAGARPIGCGECVPATSTSCDVGPFKCSIWWDDNYCP